MEKKKIIIIDGNAIVHRAYHALPKLTTKSGKVVNAVYGFLLILWRVFKDFKPDFAIVAFDFPAPTFRDKIYKEYKAKRKKAPDELYEQIPEVKKVLRAFGIKFFELKGYEADDLIGTIVKLAEKKQIFPKIEVIITTGDLDALQLIDNQTKVLLLKRGIKEAVLYDKEEVKKRYQIEPEQLIDFKALRGDPSDNIPGISGIGEKTAINLVKQFGSLENLYKAIEENRDITKKISQRVREQLMRSKEEAFFSRKLVEIRKDAPINFNLQECRIDKENLSKAKKILEEFEFFSLIKRLPEIFNSKTEEEQLSDSRESIQQKLV